MTVTEAARYVLKETVASLNNPLEIFIRLNYDRGTTVFRLNLQVIDGVKRDVATALTFEEIERQDNELMTAKIRRAEKELRR